MSWGTELRIHDDIERGSNETIKLAGTGISAIPADTGCCGGASGANKL